MATPFKPQYSLFGREWAAPCWASFGAVLLSAQQSYSRSFAQVQGLVKASGLSRVKVRVNSCWLACEPFHTMTDDEGVLGRWMKRCGFVLGVWQVNTKSYLSPEVKSWCGDPACWGAEQTLGSEAQEKWNRLQLVRRMRVLPILQRVLWILSMYLSINNHVLQLVLKGKKRGLLQTFTG